jgi:hypothetical protein
LTELAGLYNSEEETLTKVSDMRTEANKRADSITNIDSR